MVHLEVLEYVWLSEDVSRVLTRRAAEDAARDLNLVPKVEKTYTGEFYTPPPEKRRTFSNEKIKKVLGIKFRTIPDTLRDTLDDFSKRGWLTQFEA